MCWYDRLRLITWYLYWPHCWRCLSSHRWSTRCPHCTPRGAHFVTYTINRSALGFLWRVSDPFGWSLASSFAGTAEAAAAFLCQHLYTISPPPPLFPGRLLYMQRDSNTRDRWCRWLQQGQTDFLRLLFVLAAGVVNLLVVLIKIRVCHILGQLFFWGINMSILWWGWQVSWTELWFSSL